MKLLIKILVLATLSQSVLAGTKRYNEKIDLLAGEAILIGDARISCEDAQVVQQAPAKQTVWQCYAGMFSMTYPGIASTNKTSAQNSAKATCTAQIKDRSALAACFSVQCDPIN